MDEYDQESSYEKFIFWRKEILYGYSYFNRGSYFRHRVMISAFNTKIRYGFFTHYDSRSKGLGWLAILLIIIGLGIVLLKAYLNGQLG